MSPVMTDISIGQWRGFMELICRRAVIRHFPRSPALPSGRLTIVLET